jgi:predicted metal-binding protein
MTRSFEEPDPPEAALPLHAPVVPLAPMRLYVCVTCRGADPDASGAGPRPGAILLERLRAEPAHPAIAIVPVECLSVCKRSCAVSFAAPGKWTYVYGDLPAEVAAATLLRGARLYAEAPDGLIPWKLRPDALKSGVVARVPPLPDRTP